MSNIEAGPAEKQASSNVRATSDRGNAALHIEDESISSPPDGGYGWAIVVAILFLNAVTWGFNTSFGVYLSHYEAQSTFANTTPLMYSLVGSLSVAVALLCAPLANILTTRFGHRIPMLIGQCMAGLCITFGTFIVCQGLVFGIGLGLVSYDERWYRIGFVSAYNVFPYQTLVPSQPLLAHWFDRKLSLAQGLANAGSGLGGVILSNTTRLLIDGLSVKYSLIVNGTISAGVLVPCILVMKPRLRDSGARSEPLQVSWLFHRGFVWVWIWGALAMMSFYVALYSIAIFATDGLGLSQSHGAIVQSLLAAGLMIGRPLAGLTLDKFGRINIAIVLSILDGIACCAIWLPAKSFATLAVFAFVQGAAGGAVWSAAAPVTASIVGVKHLGSAMAMFWLSLVVPVFVGNPLAVLLLDYSREHLGRSGADAYAISTGFCGGLAVAAGICLYGAKWYLQGSAKLLCKV
ncbi:hypothetical protein MBLNU13_g07606t2 [Cladosporium sp. NU13]